MKFRVNRNKFAEIFKNAHRIAKRKTPVPQVDNILLTLDPDRNQVVLRATDLYVHYIGRVEAAFSGVATAGRIDLLIAPESLTSAVESYTEDLYVGHDPDTNSITVLTDTLNISVNAVPCDDFPRQETETAKIKLSTTTQALRQAIHQTAYLAAPKEDMRPHMTGVLLDKGEKNDVRLVSSNGDMLFQSVLDSEAPTTPWPGEAILIPKDALKLLYTTIGTTKAETAIAVSDRTCSLSWGAESFSVRLFEGDFPHYEDLVSDCGNPLGKASAVLKKTEFSKILKQLVPGINTNYRGVEFSAGGGTCSTIAENPGLPKISVSTPARTNGNYSSIVQLRYLADAVKRAPGKEVQVFVGSAPDEEPLCVRAVNDDSYLALIMPMVR